VRHFHIETKVRKETKMKGRRKKTDACRATLVQTIPTRKGLIEKKKKKKNKNKQLP
jgi:hypothetical protein